MNKWQWCRGEMFNLFLSKTLFFIPKRVFYVENVHSTTLLHSFEHVRVVSCNIQSFFAVSCSMFRSVSYFDPFFFNVSCLPVFHIHLITHKVTTKKRHYFSLFLYFRVNVLLAGAKMKNVCAHLNEFYIIVSNNYHLVSHV